MNNCVLVDGPMLKVCQSLKCIAEERSNSSKWTSYRVRYTVKNQFPVRDRISFNEELTHSVHWKNRIRIFHCLLAGLTERKPSLCNLLASGNRSWSEEPCRIWLRRFKGIVWNGNLTLIVQLLFSVSSYDLSLFCRLETWRTRLWLCI